MMKKPTYLLATALLSTLCACATKPPLPIIASNAPDAAKIRFVRDLRASSIDLYPENQCNNGITMINTGELGNTIDKIFQADNVTRVGMLDSPDTSKFNVTEISVAPGQRINMGSRIYPGCMSGASFIADAGMQYEVEVVKTPRSNCALKVSSLSLRDNAVIRNPVTGLGPMICQRAQPIAN